MREVIERWPFDGMELDFARGIVFPAGQGWPNRERLTEFIAQLRELSLAVGERRGRPFLLAARIPRRSWAAASTGLMSSAGSASN